jgi:hypothetical protein
MKNKTVEFEKVGANLKLIRLNGVNVGSLMRKFIASTAWYPRNYHWILFLNERQIGLGDLNRMKRVAIEKLTEEGV